MDFDRTKHLSDKSIKKRRIEREKLEQLEREREEKVRKEREEEEQRIEDEKYVYFVIFSLVYVQYQSDPWLQKAGSKALKSKP